MVPLLSSISRGHCLYEFLPEVVERRTLHAKHDVWPEVKGRQVVCCDGV